MQRHRFLRDGLTLSYLDAGGDGGIVIALHAHWMEGVTFERLAAALAPDWRVIALDQRGHGHSDHAKTYKREDYLGELESLSSISRAAPIRVWKFWSAATSCTWTTHPASRKP